MEVDYILQTDHKNAEARALLATILFAQDDLEQAKMEAELALHLQPGNTNAVAVMTAIYEEQDPASALAIISSGIERQSGSPALKLLKVRVLESQGKTREVLATYLELIVENPNNYIFHYRLVQYYERLAETDKAKKIIRNLVQTNPNSVDFMLWYSQFQLDHHCPNTALTLLRQFIDKHPDA